MDFLGKGGDTREETGEVFPLCACHIHMSMLHSEQEKQTTLLVCTGDSSITPGNCTVRREKHHREPRHFGTVLHIKTAS